ncbi:VOC family protein [Texcoconibacillus texcoconensis]|uniref:Catechol 2,3-dioxygenase n=1 Tax=Texcoconibacillus texcoconensis TaxID=1095777 RepID=A0A840QSL1_9BACI|nr:VOC family protein [Texcoconibacillus texcoconensis]MBB5174298.1 catechol 2,3-dioxygenase [Texcoconibacillus texcoconensis]
MSFHSNPHTYVDHVKLNVQDLQRSLKFYQEVIGFQVLKQSGSSAQLTADGKTSILSLDQPDGLTPKVGRTAGLYHFAILLPTRDHLAQFVQHIAKVGIPVGSSDHLVSEALYFSDPDGNGIEVYSDRDPSTWEWKNDEVKMTVDPLNIPELQASHQPEWDGLPEDTVMGHLHLHVSNLQEAEEFYTRGLGFEVVCRFGLQAVFISTGKYHHHIALNTWNGIGAPKSLEHSVGLQSFHITYPTVEEISDAVDRLTSLGVSVIKENDVYQVEDPSGNHVQLKVSP